MYIDSVLDIVRWLGYEPWKITYSSDNFQKLYELAVGLIKRDKAYMCHCTGGREQLHTWHDHDADGFLNLRIRPTSRRDTRR